MTGLVIRVNPPAAAKFVFIRGERKRRQAETFGRLRVRGQRPAHNKGAVIRDDSCNSRERLSRASMVRFVLPGRGRDAAPANPWLSV